MTDNDVVSQAAGAFQAAVEALAGVVPNGFRERGPGGALLAITGSQIPALNGITSIAPAPDKAEIGLLSEKAEAHVQELPWSIRLRGEPGAEIVDLAAAHGLATLTSQPFMLLQLESGPVGLESGGATRRQR
ncbi:hypothetical protein [Streptomyces sp. PSKA30]|uniref:hypothetical protein n=1 Tax=Streptomyces sp. PSKA30 TaxID=2874597 RepID=UPI001CD05C82|nr:hypothetical protein [Streptomyces sp. PSKA30]MBZ9641841.1 hypothetical protein [Streptomyces sp. PSKA30]